MWEQQVAFWVLAVAMAAAAIGVVRTSNVVHAALFLVVVLAGAAGQYLLLVAEFVAWVQVLIYIGAVVILFLFGIMLTRAPMGGEGRRLDNDQRWAAVVVALFVFGVLTALLVDAFGANEIHFSSQLVAQGSTNGVSSSLFRNFLVPFEVVSMLLLAALVGAVVLARRD
jgi:NADH-quinone oxidoreductase subunit J